jgi:hypothetical protein
MADAVNLKSQVVTASADHVENTIRLVRGHRVILDEDLAGLYGVSVKRLNEQVRRNIGRFPADFMFQIQTKELGSLRSQIATLKRSRGEHRKYLPLAFTEQGVAMLSSVLRSPRAVQVNIEIMRAFVRLRRLLETNADLARKLDALEQKYDGQFGMVFEAIRELMAPPAKPRKQIGFRTPSRTHPT